MSRELPAESSPLQEKAPLVRMYCHLLLQPGSCTLEAHKCEDNFRSFSKGSAELPPPSVEGCFRQQIDAARCSVITGRIPGRVKVVFVFFFFGLIIAHTARQGGGGLPSISICRSVRALLRQDTITRTPQGGCWIS